MKRYVRSSTEGSITAYYYSNVAYSEGQVIELQREELLDDTIREIYKDYLPKNLNLDNIIYMEAVRCDDAKDTKYCYEVLPIGTTVKTRKDCSPLFLTQELENDKRLYVELNKPVFLKYFINLYADSYVFSHMIREQLKQRYNIVISDTVQYISNKCMVKSIHQINFDDAEEDDTSN